MKAANGYYERFLLPLSGAGGLNVGIYGKWNLACAGAVERAEGSLFSLPASLSSDRMGAATRNAFTSIFSLAISSSFSLRTS
jgi:hypothetical protein